ncbi:MAG: hypothetical protein B7X99_12740 [Rhizobiales bacterium 17-65-6]|nr:MAG: hypothetical protein B7Y70_03135 [Rhizobiales bacterium 35-68-8]OYZ98069.1 MAG: hypothetical protein B7X99_12740 [Rhizobiales bacterium 17-65-6]
MRRRPALLPLVALVLALAGGRAGAQQAPAAPPAPPTAVLELFTSQGCASCPPADALLEELAADPRVIAITLAVDYWDYIGWKDTLAKHGHSLRQKAYAEQRGDRMIYTPQIIVDGVAPAKGSDKAAVHKAMAKAKDIGNALTVPVALAVKGTDLVIDVGALPHAGGHAGTVTGDIWVCPVLRNHEVAIGRGENAGKTITYTNVVRGWIRLGPWTGRAATFSVPLDRVRQEQEDGVVVMVQSGSPTAPGPILGAARLALN